MSSAATSDMVIKQLVRTIRNEMNEICSDDHDSIIKDTYDGIQYFKWDRLFFELARKMPTLMKFLLALIQGKNDSKRVCLVCCVASMLLKQRYSKMALLQRAVSVLLYGNGTSKKVYNCLQPLMVCLSYTGTLKLIDRLSHDHDIKVQYWCHDLTDNLKKRQRAEQSVSSAAFTLLECEEDAQDVNEIEYEMWEYDVEENEEFNNEGSGNTIKWDVVVLHYVLFLENRSELTKSAIIVNEVDSEVNMEKNNIIR
jgi:hypothetical protein